MGCCISSTNKPPNHNPHPPNQLRHHRLPESDTFSVVRPTPPPEEETVKEVLSETPFSKPTETHYSAEVEEENKVEPKLVEVVSEVSEVSEMCSISESFSTSTITEKRGEEVMSVYDGEDKHRVVERSPAKVPRKRPCSGELAGGKERRVVRSPAKRSEPLPEKRSPIMTRGQVNAQRRNVGSTGIRRDSGECSGRRSRSPVTRREGGVTRGVKGGSLPVNVNGRTGDRQPAVAEEKSTDGGLTAPEESLENPLVSLECFIFL